MNVKTYNISIKSKGENDMIDLTERVSKKTTESDITNGIVTVFVSGSTGALTTIEYEPGLKQDFPAILSRLAPKNQEYGHEKMWHDGNGHSHVKASLVGPSLTVPIINGTLTLGTWQQIVFVEFDVRSKSRQLILQVVGE
ncbi:MAG: YjbQ family protein [Nitrosopumilaceae archaeon]|nr:YjbQ family protein [Nitrosopumilaceae archaeon]NIU00860.1 YjbQ family protein [Nitrosopumilaceae archaeon]NIU87313.1 YjbQ family protein [Nitrosopumilaceae archaeon]NIV65841.1 YjbQ family protein [Nitrosopumilaceae archaeon]NIX61462.1 YjbQ family protein [Nitrosopumilaceae archaeon]